MRPYRHRVGTGGHEPDADAPCATEITMKRDLEQLSPAARAAALGCALLATSTVVGSLAGLVEHYDRDPLRGSARTSSTMQAHPAPAQPPAARQIRHARARVSVE
jgi:hypothetical protein